MTEKLDILFFAPPMFADGAIPREGLVNDNHQGREIPRGLHCIASFLHSKGIRARIVVPDAFFSSPIASKDLLIEEINDLIFKKISEFDPAYIGFSLMFGFTERTIVTMTRFTKRAFPDKVIMTGGSHASFVAPRLLSSEYNTGIDVVVRGEGERTVGEIVSGKKDWCGIAGISFKNSNKVVIHNEWRQELPILDLPSNDYLLVETGSVDIAHFNHTLQYSRGCSFACKFCVNKSMWGQKVRSLSVDSFYQDLHTVLGFNQQRKDSAAVTVIMDDDLFANQRYWESLFPILEDAKKVFPDAQFAAQARVDKAKKDNKQTHRMLEWARKIGFMVIFLGVESGSQTILDAMGKRCRVEWIEQACRNLKKHDIPVAAFWMFGHPGATVEEENISIDLMEFLLSEKLLDAVEPHITTPFPGTLMRDDPRVKILLSEDEEVDDYMIVGGHRPIHCLIDPANNKIVMSSDQILGAYKKGMEIKEKYLGSETTIENVESM